jgi:hypothetical protein
MENVTEKVLVSPTSVAGHYVKGAKKVVNLDNINETFLVEGAAVLETSNHTTLEMPTDCLITCQTVYNPFTEMYNKSRD